MTREEWEDWKATNRNDFEALISLANDEGHEDLFNDLLSTDQVDDFVRNRLDNCGWQGVADCISDIINDKGDSYYEVDGYGNLTTCNSWDSYVDDLESEMDFEMPICDECNEEAEAIHYPEDWCKEQGLSDEFKEKLVKYVTFYGRNNYYANWHMEYEYCENCFNKLKKLVVGWDGETEPDEYEESLEETD